MPTVPKTSAQDIVRAARRLIARDGTAALSLQEVAKAVGVRAPSLYKHFEDRAAIVRAVAVEVGRELAAAQLAAAGAPGTLEERLAEVARAQREYARQKPHLYGLVFDPASEELAPPDAASRAQLQGLFDLLAQWMGGRAQLLEGARLLTAFTHGFSMMERARAFQLGGSVDQAFEFGLARVLAALKGA